MIQGEPLKEMGEQFSLSEQMIEVYVPFQATV